MDVHCRKVGLTYDAHVMIADKVLPNYSYGANLRMFVGA